jgi:outer membrane protein
MGFATGDLGEFISNASFRGGLIEYRKNINENLAIGAEVSWNVFYEKKDRDTYTSGTASLTGVQYRTQNSLPILIAAEYVFTPDNALKPYVGFGIGTMFSERTTDMGIYRLLENPWSFALKPEVGLLYEVSPGNSFKIAGRYYNGFETNQLASQGYFSISAGIAFHL